MLGKDNLGNGVYRFGFWKYFFCIMEIKGWENKNWNIWFGGCVVLLKLGNWWNGINIKKVFGIKNEIWIILFN